MKMHRLTLVLLAATFLLLVLNIWTAYKLKSWKRIYYTAAVSVADKHPINLSSKIIAVDGAEYDKPSIFDENEFAHWGWNSGSSYDIESMLLPDSLVIEWVAIREQKKFGGTYKLPTQKIDSFFKHRKDKLMLDTDYYGKIKKYFSFDIGVAPEGNVTIWIVGKGGFRKEIMHFKAKEIKDKEAIDRGTKVYLDTPQSNDSIIRESPELEKWQNYQKKFNYFVMYSNLPKGVNTLKIRTFNCENDSYDISKENKIVFHSGSPSYIKSNAFDGEKYFEIRFKDNLISIFEAQEKLLKPNDTLVFLIAGSEDSKSISYTLTSIDEMNLEVNQ